MRALGTAALCAVGVVAAAAAAVMAQATAPLTVRKTIVLPGGPGGFDWMLDDVESDRVFATHKGTKTVAIVDLKTDTAMNSVPVGSAQGVAVDRAVNKVFLGDEEEHKVVILDYKSLKKIGEIPVTGPVDDVVYCPANGKVYADHDDGEDVWVIDAKTNKVVGAVKIAEAPEKIEYDRTSGRLYQNIKSNSTVQVIDPRTDKIEKTFATAPATGPHGLAVDGKTERLFTAGSNGKLVVLDIKTGKRIADVDIPRGVDQIAFDRGNRRIYCACQGAIAVVEETDGGAELVGTVPTPKGCHTIAVDSKRHTVWTCYTDGKSSYLVKLAP